MNSIDDTGDESGADIKSDKNSLRKGKDRKKCKQKNSIKEWTQLIHPKQRRKKILKKTKQL